MALIDVYRAAWAAMTYENRLDLANGRDTTVKGVFTDPDTGKKYGAVTFPGIYRAFLCDPHGPFIRRFGRKEIRMYYDDYFHSWTIEKNEYNSWVDCGTAINGAFARWIRVYDLTLSQLINNFINKLLSEGHLFTDIEHDYDSYFNMHYFYINGWIEMACAGTAEMLAARTPPPLPDVSNPPNWDSPEWNPGSNPGWQPPTNYMIYPPNISALTPELKTKQGYLTLNRGRKGLRRTSHGNEDGLGTTRT